MSSGSIAGLANFANFSRLPRRRFLAVSSVGAGALDRAVLHWEPSKRSAPNPQEFRVLVEPEEPRCEFSCFQHCRFFSAGVVHTQLLDISMRTHGGAPAWEDPNRGRGACIGLTARLGSSMFASWRRSWLALVGILPPSDAQNRFSCAFR